MVADLGEGRGEDGVINAIVAMQKLFLQFLASSNPVAMPFLGNSAMALIMHSYCYIVSSPDPSSSAGAYRL